MAWHGHMANNIRPSTYLQSRICHKLQCHEMRCFKTISMHVVPSVRDTFLRPCLSRNFLLPRSELPIVQSRVADNVFSKHHWMTLQTYSMSLNATSDAYLLSANDRLRPLQTPPCHCVIVCTSPSQVDFEHWIHTGVL